MVSAGNKSQRRSGDSIYRLPNDRAVTTTSRSILASRFSATEEVLMTNSPFCDGRAYLIPAVAITVQMLSPSNSQGVIQAAHIIDDEDYGGGGLGLHSPASALIGRVR